MTWVAGVDGCRLGWVVVEARLEEGRITALETRTARDMDEVIALGRQPEQVVLDMPIGLLEERVAGGREADRAARRILGRRASSVFSPPVRPILGASSWEQVRGKGISIQSFHIMGKIAQVDRWITPARQSLVCEGHPELAFARLAGAPMTHNKKRAAGFRERLAVLEPHLPGVVAWAETRHYRRKDVARDDLLDAAVLVLVARDRLAGRAVCVPATRPLDARGLEMVIWTTAP